jgi:hypothetical protein
MQVPNRADVTGYGMILLGIVTMIQYSGIVENYILSGIENVFVSGGMLVLGGSLAVIGLVLTFRPTEMHRGTEQAPYWMLGAAAVETVACAWLFLWWLF